MERFVVLPFSIGGCASHSSVSVIENSPKKSKTDHQNQPSTARAQEGGDSMKMKNSIRFLPVPRPNISIGIHRLIKSFKNFSQLFVYKEAIEDMEMDMEIGFPTDVKHVAHIGWDGSTATTTTNNITTNHSKGWEMLKAPEHQMLSSFPSISFKQFELAMAAQAKDSTTPTPTSLVNNIGSSTKQPSS